jgi:hypothetical protein
MRQAGYPEVQLIPSVAKAGDGGSSVTANAGTLQFVKQDEKFGASNPQGFSGGGFSIGGAEAIVSTRRCETSCGGGGSSDIVGGGTGDAPVASGPSSSESTPPSGDSTSGSDSTSYDVPSTPTGSDTTGSGGYGAASTSTVTTDSSGAGLGGSGSLSSGSSGASGTSGATGDSGSSTAVVPSNEQAAAGVSTPGAGVAVQQQAAVAYTELGPKSAEWLRDLYLAAALGLGLIFVGQRLARAFS